jgi:branched-chain amino acid transport system permease protein
MSSVLGAEPLRRQWRLYALVLAFGILGPILMPHYTFQFAVLWVMVLFSLTWDVMGGQMGYNSLGNIFFFGVGMYTSAVVQIGLYYDVAKYTSAAGAIKVDYTTFQYYFGMGIGVVAAGFMAVAFAIVLGWVIFGLRGPYFAIGTLGIALAAGEFTGSVQYLGGGGGIAMPVFPGGPTERSVFFYVLCFGLAIATFLVLRRVYAGRFGHAINAIRDDEEKAEAMGIHTLRYKIVGWSISAFFLGMSGALFGNMVGFIEPLEVAFPTVTFGIFMVVMSLLGGKGTLWGPILGAVLFHFVKEVTWTYMLGWQWVALGALIIINVVFFQQGIMGWLQEKYPEKFGIIVDDEAAQTDPDLEAARRGGAAQ